MTDTWTPAPRQDAAAGGAPLTLFGQPVPGAPVDPEPGLGDLDLFSAEDCAPTLGDLDLFGGGDTLGDLDLFGAENTDLGVSEAEPTEAEQGAPAQNGTPPREEEPAAMQLLTGEPYEKARTAQEQDSFPAEAEGTVVVPLPAVSVPAAAAAAGPNFVPVTSTVGGPASSAPAVKRSAVATPAGWNTAGDGVPTLSLSALAAAAAPKDASSKTAAPARPPGRPRPHWP